MVPPPPVCPLTAPRCLLQARQEGTGPLFSVTAESPPSLRGGTEPEVGPAPGHRLPDPPSGRKGDVRGCWGLKIKSPSMNKTRLKITNPTHRDNHKP